MPSEVWVYPVDSMDMPARPISEQIPEHLKGLLPETYQILVASGLTVHDSVRSVVLSGSRGPKGGFRHDSDIDLSLLVGGDVLNSANDRGRLLEEVLAVTTRTWKSQVQLDVVAVFDKLSCGLRCFQVTDYPHLHCAQMALDCFGLYKNQKGFHGFVADMQLSIQKVYPIAVIWSAYGEPVPGSFRVGR
jgi:predicted nucleotidyltransferase